ncbi:hypothetical protein [Mycobacterium ahvazicum]|uniref:hypothetical protein n=1 Tax=Mycobacterium ahvazicum TaxID=1964395 RepID=UPI000BB6F662|nr:hypothetical protein [Mycobacterium ahvazicum]
MANGRPDPANGGRTPSLSCREAAIDFLIEVTRSHQVLVDLARDIQAEYAHKLNSDGEPGVGDRFYFQILMNGPMRVERIDLPRSADGSYADFPVDPELERFDPSDRKFAALARRMRAPVVNTTDSDWLHHRDPLARNGIAVLFLCGCDRGEWFES